MKARIAGVLLSLSLCTVARSAERPLVEVVSRYFTTYSVLPEGETRKYVAGLEAFYRLLAAATGNMQQGNVGSLRVYLLGGTEVQHLYGGASYELGGWVSQDGVGADMLMVVPADRNQDYRLPFTMMGQRIALTHCLGGCMPWFDVGLAEFASTARFYPDRIEFRARPERLELLLAPKWIPAEDFFTVPYEKPAYVERRMPDGFAAQAWLMMHYLYVGNPQAVRKLATYGMSVNRGAEPSEALLSALGMTYAELDKTLRAYADGKRYIDMTVRPHPLPESQVTVRTLDRAQSARVLLELAMRSTETYQQKKELQKLCDGLPDEPWLLADSAQILTEYFQSQEARLGALESVVARMARLPEQQDADVEATLAKAYLNVGAPDAWHTDWTVLPGVADPERVRFARAHFERALKIDPDHLDALSGYALTCALLNECMDVALSRVKRAVALSPANWRAVLEAALIQTRRGAKDEADGFWSLLTRIAPTIETRRYAMKRTRAYTDRSITIQ